MYRPNLHYYFNIDLPISVYRPIDKKEGRRYNKIKKIDKISILFFIDFPISRLGGIDNQ